MTQKARTPRNRAESPRGRLKFINKRLKEIKEERAKLVIERKSLREAGLASKGTARKAGAAKAEGGSTPEE